MRLAEDRFELAKANPLCYGSLPKAKNTGSDLLVFPLSSRSQGFQVPTGQQLPKGFFFHPTEFLHVCAGRLDHKKARLVWGVSLLNPWCFTVGYCAMSCWLMIMRRRHGVWQVCVQTTQHKLHTHTHSTSCTHTHTHKCVLLQGQPREIG